MLTDYLTVESVRLHLAAQLCFMIVGVHRSWSQG